MRTIHLQPCNYEITYYIHSPEYPFIENIAEILFDSEKEKIMHKIIDWETSWQLLIERFVTDHEWKEIWTYEYVCNWIYIMNND